MLMSEGFRLKRGGITCVHCSVIQSNNDNFNFRFLNHWFKKPSKEKKKVQSSRYKSTVFTISMICIFSLSFLHTIMS
jgi:hypothetical protein